MVTTIDSQMKQQHQHHKMLLAGNPFYHHQLAICSDNSVQQNTNSRTNLTYTNYIECNNYYYLNYYRRQNVTKITKKHQQQQYYHFDQAKCNQRQQLQLCHQSHEHMDQQILKKIQQRIKCIIVKLINFFDIDSIIIKRHRKSFRRKAISFFENV